MKKLLFLGAFLLQLSIQAQQDSGFIWTNGNMVNGMYNFDNYYDQFDTPWVYNSLTGIPLFHPKSNWKSFSGVGGYVLAVRGDGTVWTWGINPNGTRAPNVNQFTNINQTYKSLVYGSGTTWAYGITTNGHLYALRSNGTENPIDTIHTYTKISRGNTALSVLRSDSTIWQYSINSSGAATNPRELGPGFKYVDMARANVNSWGIRADGTLWKVYTSAPVAFHQEGTSNNWVSIDSDGLNAFGRQSNGTIWAQGNSNTYGQLGIGTTSGASNITQIGTDTDWARIIPGQHHTLAFKSNGALYAWGRNDRGQLGDSSNVMRTSPVLIGAPGEYVNAFAADGNSVFIRTWGYDGSTSGLSTNDQPTVQWALQAYPNPATNYINLNNLPLRSTIIVYDLTGAEIFNALVDNPELRIQTANWPRGQYLIKCYTQGITREGKILLQ